MKTPVAVVTGFLGSGKTTLIARALADPRLANTAVIVNEFGEISLDHLLVSHARENVIELRNGCLCCTIREDLAMTLRDLHLGRVLGELAPFDHVIVETTGLADPRPLVQTLMANPAFRSVYSTDTVIACADVTTLAGTVADHAAAAGQIAFADLIVLTKGDLACASELGAARALVRHLNPAAETVAVEKGAIDPLRLFRRSLFEAEAASTPDALRRWIGMTCAPDVGRPHAHGADSGYAAHAIVHDGPLSLSGTSVFLNRLANQERDRLLRIKGLAGFREKGGRPGVLHAVQNKFYPVEWLDGWPDEDHRSRLVIIGTGIDRAGCDALFSQLCV